MWEGVLSMLTNIFFFVNLILSITSIANLVTLNMQKMKLGKKRGGGW
jgi:hypothetical protein